MAVKKLSNRYLSAFTLELALLLQAGITISDGLQLMIEDDDDAGSRALLSQLAEQVDQGRPLSEAFRSSAMFPEYLIHMVEIGEKAGRPEETFRALSAYYDSRERLNSAIRNTLLYPVVLLLLMLVVIVVLLVKVLPIFNEVFQQMGSGLYGFAAGLLRLGEFLSGASLVFAVVLGLLLAAGIAFWLSPQLRASALRRYYNLRGDRGIAAKIAGSRFASAMSMALMSGLNSEDALDMAAALSSNSPRTDRRFAACRALLAEGKGLAEALAQTGIFPTVYCRMLALGVKSGTTDTVMAEIARRMEENVDEELGSLLGRVEPTLVIITSLIVGLILLSVMLPLMNIMSSIG